MRKYNLTFITCLLGFLWSTTSYAIQVSIDSFSILQNGSTFLSDTFSDGIPPPSGPNGPNTYSVNSVNGTFPANAESGGFLQLNSANGVLTQNALGQNRISLMVTQRGTSSELSTGTLLMTGVFSLVIPTGPRNNGYGIRFIDNVPNSQAGSQETLDLMVQFYGAQNQPVIRYYVANNNLGTITTLGTAPISAPLGDDEVCLYLSRPDANSNDFYASYAYGTGGRCGTAVQFATPGIGFQYENFVRGQFRAFETPVPEPATWLLMGVGLVALIAMQRRFGNV